MGNVTKISTVYVIKSGSSRLVFGEFFRTKKEADSYILNYGREGWRSVEMRPFKAAERQGE